MTKLTMAPETSKPQTPPVAAEKVKHDEVIAPVPPSAAPETAVHTDKK